MSRTVVEESCSSVFGSRHWKVQLFRSICDYSRTRLLLLVGTYLDVGGTGRQVDEMQDVRRVNGGAGDHASAVGVSAEHHSRSSTGDGATDLLDVIVEASERKVDSIYSYAA